MASLRIVRNLLVLVMFGVLLVSYPTNTSALYCNCVLPKCNCPKFSGGCCSNPGCHARATLDCITGYPCQYYDASC